MNIKECHEKILYPVVRVRAETVGGSGVIIYSSPDPKDSTKYINLILTCEHVIDKAIKIKDDWDPVLKKDKKKEFFDEVYVEVFDYDESTVISNNSMRADILAYDKYHDLAILKLANTKRLPFVANIIPKEKIDSIRLFDPVWTSGCSLLHDPFSNPGTLTYLREVIDQKAYLMANASGVFGNSGGGLFHGQEGYLLGLTSRVTVTQLGFGIDIMTWMNFSTHPKRLYEFFDEQEFKFIYDPRDDYYTALVRREKRRKQVLKDLLTGMEDTSRKEEDIVYG